MKVQAENTLLLDHVEVQIVTTDPDDSPVERNTIVQLNPDHPGFSDEKYRRRRNQFAQIALEYKPGTEILDAPYTSEEHGVWRAVWEVLEPAHREFACAEYMECLRRLNFSRERIPQLGEVTAKVHALSGFRLEPVVGLVEPRVFLESLANGVFLSTQYIRHHSTPLYTPEPDVVHEVIGHAVLLASERIAELNRLVGRAVMRTRSSEALERLARVYWFTIEFGVLREAGQVKAYGTGLLSSAGELKAMGRASLRPFDLEAASYQDYDSTKYQPVLFCLDSFQEMYERLRDCLINWK